MDSSPDFRDTGIEGMERFVQRLWKLFNRSKKLNPADKKEVYIKLHQTISKVTDNVSKFKYNTSIASIMELVNVISVKGTDKEVLRNLCLLLAPFAPHLSEEVWVEVLGQTFSVHKALWPKFDESLAENEVVTIIVQVGGKVRGTVEVKSQNSKVKSDVEEVARKDEKVAKWLEGNTVKKVIFVPGKVINFVF
jgi:leucyl-tRNA synthetase